MGHHKVVKASEVLQHVENDGSPSLGIGLFDVIEHFAHEELRFVRQTPIKCCLPTIGSSYRMFFSAIFGYPPTQVGPSLKRRLAELPNFSEQVCTMTSFADLFAPENLFIRRLSSLHLKPQRGRSHKRGDCLFVLDAKSTIDILDYWNLRALGWNIIPIPVQAFGNVKLKVLSETVCRRKFVAVFI